MARAAMYLSGFPPPPLFSLQDSLCQAVFIRREQFRIFETMIGVLTAGLSLDPKLATKIENLMTDYIDLVIPGSKESKKREDEQFVEKTAKALGDIAALLAGNSRKQPK